MIFETTLTVINSSHADLEVAKELVYDKCGYGLRNLELGAESIEYGACSFELNGKAIQYRVSKITPKKNGQFVAIWKRNTDGKTVPFHVSDEIDFIIISTKCDNTFGQFIFPKSILADRGILSQNGKEGKRGIRVYPPWVRTTSNQAAKTQAGKLNFF